MNGGGGRVHCMSKAGNLGEGFINWKDFLVSGSNKAGECTTMPGYSWFFKVGKEVKSVK